MAINFTIANARAVFTVTDNWDDTETLVIGGKTYTFRATVGTLDGSVHIAADEDGDLLNLAAAVNLDPTAGELGTTGDYGTSMVINPEVIALVPTATVITFVAKTPGTVGNLIATTDTHGEGTWAGGAVVMENGAGDLEGWLTSLFALNQINSEVVSELRKLTPEAD